ncbi:helix-turn-helix domain-containing protein [Domibacillus sp. A3M-37]|uniref:CdaR family transcriptional regulator n=1 Tax=Domibacillus sp. A3M-37 TaxID=2962037 RepID=UPI0020B86120|nr:sugar diacid recognition domain-containing protein [Domibacillus sp. A3M-37]MCP3761358.1 helix-turn-helix domain-containing protein [Domibacillus sp. A3M-37]
MLTKAIAKEIVKETSLRLDRNINIMNNEGMIIASCDESRINTVHEGARQVLETSQPFIIHESESAIFKGSQPGINLPIVFQEEIVGVIGITGNPEHMTDLGGLVKMTTELMIKQEYIASQMEWTQRTKEMIFEELLKKEPSYDHINRGLNLLDVELHPPLRMAMIQLKPDRTETNQRMIQSTEKTFKRGTGFAGFTHTHRMIVLASGAKEQEFLEEIHQIQSTFKQLRIVNKIVYSTPFNELDEFKQSYMDCDLTLKISAEQLELIPFAAIESKALIHQLDEAAAKRFSDRVLTENVQKQAMTLTKFFLNNLNIQKTADDLFIHRNTLLYRLEKIKENTGYDPKNFHDALTLQMALWIHSIKSDSDR